MCLTGIRTSCGCTKPVILTSKVKPGETAKINAIFDTHHFHGPRGATVTVSVQKVGKSIDYGELQFSVKGQIRRDVVFSPGEIFFDDVTLTDDVVRAVRVSYAGDPQWQIVDVKSTSPKLTIEAKEVSRDLNSGRVDYDLLVKLDRKQSMGTFTEYVTIVTNDAKTTGMPIVVKGRVKPVIEAAPIRLGVLNQGKMIEKKLIVRGTNAFRIEQIITNKSEIQFAPAEGEKSLHLLIYTLDTSKAGTIDDELTIVTNTPGQRETKVKFSAQIVPATIAGR